MGTKGTDQGDLQSIKHNYQALGAMTGGSGTQVVFSSVLLVRVKGLRWSGQIRCQQKGFVFMTMEPSFLGRHWVRLIRQGKSIFADSPANLVRGVLHWEQQEGEDDQQSSEEVVDQVGKKKLLHFSLFLGIYLTAILSNGLIITAIACDHRLQTPMYCFLLNLSVLDLGTISNTVHKNMTNSVWNIRAISYLGCAAQVFLFCFSVQAEYSLLTVMAYDHYIAICKPLHYRTLMGSRACVKMAAAAWASGFLSAVLCTGNTFSIPLCQGNVVDQFFCEIPQILKFSCSDSFLREVEFLVSPMPRGSKMSNSSSLNEFLLLAFANTRELQLLHFSLFLGIYLAALLALDLVVIVLYSVVPPAVNPLIYSMRNKELKDALRKVMS
ncbi:olfactory receptor 14A16-like [Apteryx mantelli]|uniref:Olfactory receptor 14A16-like n=1 Tax=Apteryx mantelli TaxID=2696672 RepID=A0ABM4G778_9AVES